MKALFILAASAAMTASSVAYAADAVEQIPQAPQTVETPVVFSWNGPYIGAHTGYAWGDGDAPGGGSDDFDSWRLGGFVGYNWQFSSGFVAGIEGDVNYDWNENSYAGGIDVDTGFSGSVRGRVGYAMDRALIFAAAGWTATTAHIDGGGFDDDDMLNGWTVGAGVDYAFTDNIFGRLEYRYNDFGNGSLAGADFDFSQHVINVGIGVKF
ncbi:outer membrane protein [Neorhizobium tomejilense]|uniref:outer membrane protein n=1 Tax=Neorhizobium tomejilense TaxID=2093828 RepID=UPI000CF9C94D|nr:outer membrane protein [Neorhizobium tomejilense]